MELCFIFSAIKNIILSKKNPITHKTQNIMKFSAQSHMNMICFYFFLTENMTCECDINLTLSVKKKKEVNSLFFSLFFLSFLFYFFLFVLGWFLESLQKRAITKKFVPILLRQKITCPKPSFQGYFWCKPSF